MNPVVRSALARVLSFVPTAVATLLTSRAIIHEFDVRTFANVSLILTLIALVPLNSLGVGAAITSSYAADGPDTEHSRRVTLTAVRVLAVSSAASVAGSLLLTALGLWPRILGASSGPNLYCGLAMAIYAVSFVPGLGTSMLLGVHRNHVTVLLQMFFNPLILVLSYVVIGAGLSGDVLMLVPPIALVAVNVLTGLIATRATGISWLQILRAVPDRRRHPGASIRATSGPALIISLTTPVLMYSDRIVLSHTSSTQAVADYTVALQIFGPLLALIAATSQPLWPVYAQAHSAGGPGPPLGRVLAGFGAAAALVGGVLALLANPVAGVIGNDQLDLGVLLPVSGAVFTVVSALASTTAATLMDPPGLRMMSVCALLALPLNLGLSILLGHHLGAPGPLLATIAVTGVVQLVPCLLFAYRREARLRDGLPAAHRPRHSMATAATARPADAAASRPRPGPRRPRPGPLLDAPAPRSARRPAPGPRPRA